MAQDTTKIVVGRALVYISDYVTAGGAGTFVEVGHTNAPSTLTAAFDNFDVETEQALGIVKTVPIRSNFSLRVPMLEVTVSRIGKALRQPVANVTGTTPNFSLAVGDAVEIYHQLKLESYGHGTTAVRTVTLWKCQAATIADIPFAKAGTQLLDVTFRVIKDDSVATLDKYFKIVDT